MITNIKKGCSRLVTDVIGWLYQGHLAVALMQK